MIHAYQNLIVMVTIQVKMCLRKNKSRRKALIPNVNVAYDIFLKVTWLPLFLSLSYCELDQYFKLSLHELGRDKKGENLFQALQYWKRPFHNDCVKSLFVLGDEVKILGNYTVLKEKLVLESSKFVWKGKYETLLLPIPQRSFPA